MSIPLKAVCGAATLTFALTPGVGDARVAAPGPATPETIAGEHTAVAQRGRHPGGAWYGRHHRPAMHAQYRAAHAIRLKRSRLIERWQGRADRAVRFALRQRGKPYVWGADGPGSYDCSGLVQRAWRHAGVRIPRVTWGQYHNIRKKVVRHRLRPGDLILFNGLRHVGMYVGHGWFVHSPRPGRTVTTERLRGYYRRNYVGAVRPAWPRLPKVPVY